MSSEVTCKLREEDESSKKRRLIAEILLVALVAVAYHEALNELKESLKGPDKPWKAMFLFSVFSLTALRFFIGNHLHLQKDDKTFGDPKRWLSDFLVVLLEIIVLGFVGVASQLEDQKEFAFFGFWQLLLVLYAIDVAWICLQWFQHCKNYPKPRTGKWPKPWLWLNVILIVILLACRFCAGGFDFDPKMLGGLAVINLVAFGFDVRMGDWDDLFGPGSKGSSVTDPPR